MDSLGSFELLMMIVFLFIIFDLPLVIMHYPIMDTHAESKSSAFTEWKYWQDSLY